MPLPVPKPVVGGVVWSAPKPIRAILYERPYKLDAEVYGRFGVCQDPTDINWYYLIHLPSGYSTAGLPLKDDVKRIGELLWSKCCLSYRIEDPKECREDIQKKHPWAILWVFAMRAAKTWLDPQPYIEGRVK